MKSITKRQFATSLIAVFMLLVLSTDTFAQTRRRQARCQPNTVTNYTTMMIIEIVIEIIEMTAIAEIIDAMTTEITEIMTMMIEIIEKTALVEQSI